MSRVGIVGGGPAGLALAHDLVQAGHQVTLFEAAPELGGLARSFRFGDLQIERYYHFICADDTGYFRKLRELEIEAELCWRPTKMGFFFSGRLYPFSSIRDLLAFDGVPLTARLRYGLLVFYCTLLRDWRRLDGLAAEPWLIRALGREGYLATWYPLLRIKFNQFHDQISAAWVWHRIHRVARSRKTPLHRERLGYLRSGTDALVGALEAALRRQGASLRAGTPVRRIVISEGVVRGIETADGVTPFDYVVSAAPLPAFLKAAPELPADYAHALAAIDFIGVICIVLRLRQRLSENFWLNVNDARVPFNGCIEYTNLNPEMTPDGSSILYVPYYLPRSHQRFSYDDRRLIDECAEALAVINPAFRADWILQATVSRDPYAQVVCAHGFKERVPAHRTPVENLFLIESSQLYPADRTISGTIDLARNVADLIAGAEARRQRIAAG